jgi:hypothetical protein
MRYLAVQATNPDDGSKLPLAVKPAFPPASPSFAGMVPRVLLHSHTLKETMRTYSTTTITAAVLTTLLFAFSAFARDHSAMNGTWTLVPAKSDFAGQPVVQTGTVTIADHDGIIIVTRSFKYAGATDTYFYRDITDAENNATIHTGKDLKSKTRWDRDVLKVTTTESGAVTVESYSLAPDGTMMASVVRPEHKPITLFFQHQ